MLILILLGIALLVLFLGVDDENTAKTWNEFCNLECLERRISKKCC